MNAPVQTDAEAQSLNLERTRLHDFEEFWRDHYHWLKDKGYQLRSRYHPDWTPSWKGRKRKSYTLRIYEDHHVPLHPLLMDATRIRDHKIVMLRRADPESISDELKIGPIFSSESTISDTRNHCVPTYETLEVDPPDPVEGRNLIVVMPCLVRWEILLEEFTSVGEVIDFCGQLFEGLQFMHSLNVAHNDAKDTNIMMDSYPAFKHPPHPLSPDMKRDWSGSSKPRSRTLHPVKYYWIDYDMSVQYESNSSPLLPPGYGGDQSVPEFLRNELCNPFKVDVYCVGNVIRNNFLVGDPFTVPRANLEFLHGLISDMTHDDPLKRPTMDVVVSRFAELCKNLYWWQLRSRAPPKNEHPLLRLLLTPTHWVKQATFILLRIPAVPDYTKRK